MKHQHPDEWPSTLEKMERSFSAVAGAFVSDPPQSAVITALMLSFNALEFRIKPCIAFLGVFVKDEDIWSEKLIGMWLAEGLVESEEEGLLILKHLSNRCLVNMKHQEGYWSRSRIYSITVHDLVHDLAMTVYKESGGICQGSSSDEAFARQLQSGRRVLRIRIGNSSLNGIPNSFRCPRSVRLLGFDYSHELSHIPEETLTNAKALRTWEETLTNAKALRTWVLGSGSPFREVTREVTSLPKCISQLRILKFLDMSKTGKHRLPTCLRELKHLQYLYTSITEEVPSWVGELQSLTHFSDGGCEWKKVNEIMPCLKVVRNIWIEIDSSGDWSGARKKKEKTWTWDAVAQLTQLQKLQLLVPEIGSGVPTTHS